MICTRCLARNALRISHKHATAPMRPSISASTSKDIPVYQPHLRPRTLTTTPHPLSTSTATTSASADPPQPQRKPPAATSTSAAQPFSAGQSTTPITPYKDDPSKAPPATISSVPAGTPLKGLNYFKGKEDPVALEDHEYPAWLWTILDAPKKTALADVSGVGDEEKDPRLYSKSAKARRAANKRLRAARASNPEGAVAKTPIYEQTVDLAASGSIADDGGEGGAGEQEGDAAEMARQDLQRAMRMKRRRDIKTANFLKGMR